jgi:hypothetical protein
MFINVAFTLVYVTSCSLVLIILTYPYTQPSGDTANSLLIMIVLEWDKKLPQSRGDPGTSV